MNPSTEWFPKKLIYSHGPAANPEDKHLPTIKSVHNMKPVFVRCCATGLTERLKVEGETQQAKMLSGRMLHTSNKQKAPSSS